MKVIFHRQDSTNVTVDLESERDYPDDITDEEIKQDLEEWMWEDVDIWFEKVEE